MKPDMEDYTDIDEAAVEPRSRAMSWMVLAVAVGGFGALAYYAYNSGSKPAGEGEMLVVEADSAPIKEAPVDPEGEQFANKDKTIYDVIAPNGEQKTEKLLPDPEHPVAAANTEDATPATSTYVAPAEAKKADPLDLALSKEGGVEKTTPAPAAAPQEVAPAAAPTTATAPAEQAVTTVAEVPVVTKPKTVEKSFENPQIINEKPAPKKEAAKPAAKPKSSGGSGVIQLGAFKSEAEAQASWKKISGKHSDVLSGSPTIVKADVKGTTYYRLRTSVADAKSTCAKLSAKGQACMAVK